jgi:hypothetical protein
MVAEQVRGDGDLAPAEDGEALFGDDRLDLRDGGVVVLGVGREEGDADGVGAGLGQLEAGDLTEEGVRDLEQDARAVAGVGL